MPAGPQATDDYGVSDLPRGRRVIEVASLFTRLGFTAFGGPAAHVAMMESEVVARRHWLDRQQFLDAFAAINFIPGPNSTQLAIHLGYLRAGWVGLLTAGVCFIVPAVLVILPIAWAYVTYGNLPQAQGMMLGVNAAVVAIVIAACVRFARTALHDAFTITVAITAFGGAAVLTYFKMSQPDLMVLALALITGILRHAHRQLRNPLPTFPFMLALFPSKALAASTGAESGGLLELAGLFLKIGATLFGSGYVLVSYLQSSVVRQYGWMTEPQMLTAVSIGQFTPGPLLTTATFIGYVRGWQIYHTVTGATIGAIVATTAIFAPSFILIAIVGRFLDRLRRNPWARAAFNSVNAAVVALIAVAAMNLAMKALFIPDARAFVAVAVFVVSLLAMLRYSVNATWTILLGAIAGVAATMLGIR